MQVLVYGRDAAIQEAGISFQNVVVRVNSVAEFRQYPDALAYINLEDESIGQEYDGLKCVFVNSVLHTLPPNRPELYRFNGWPGFLGGGTWEVAGQDENLAREVLARIGKKAAMVKDEPGFIAPRVIAMIINEAGFATEEEIASREDIDTAMKLGTGYPYGPFEWLQKIGSARITALLALLSLNDERYTPAKFLKETAAAS